MERFAMSLAIRQALRALGRFPLVFASSVVGTAGALWLNHLPAAEEHTRAVSGNLTMTAWLGVGLFFSLAILAESRRWNIYIASGVQAFGAVLMAAYHYFQALAPYPTRISRFWLCMLAVHLCAALAAALGAGATMESFWRFNQRMAARLGLAISYSALIFTGLCIGLALIKNLFEISIPDGYFLDPGIAALGLFNTWFFLAGIPSASPREGEVYAYPRQLGLFAQFILLPLVTVYLIILYAYAVRTLMVWRWPTGWVTYPILSFCALAILCLFLLQPLAEKGTNRWVKSYCRHLHLALFPLLIILFAAIGRRVQEYGITENRYIVLALGVWLTGIVLHAALDAPRDIRILPASLCLVALLAAFGPWGAFEVSRKSQIQRMKNLLENEGMLLGGKLAKAPGRVPRRVAREIGGIADYLIDRGRLGDLKPWIPAIDDSGQTHSVAWSNALDGKFALLEALEIPYMPPEATGPGRSEAVAFSCRALSAPVRKVTGFDFLYADYRALAESAGGKDERDTAASMGGEGAGGRLGEGFRFRFDSAAGLLRFQAGDSAGPSLDLAGHFRMLRDRYPDAYDLNLPEEEMIVTGEDKSLRVMVKLRQMQGDADEDSARLKGFAADVFIEVKGKGRMRGKSGSLARTQPARPPDSTIPLTR